jgi:DNA-binding transcriptional MocR family regulator
MQPVLFEVETRLDEPSARGLATAVSRAVRDGVLEAGVRLPPIRTVAAELGLSPTTVSAAWSLLARNGTIRTDGRRGTTIADRQRPGSPRYQRTLDRETAFSLDLSTGVPDPALLPDLSRAVVALTEVATPGSYLDDPTLPELARTLRADWPFAAEAITVVDGAMDGIELATRVLVGFGDRVAVESPGFPPLLDLLEASGAEVVGVPVDDAGMRADALREVGAVAVVYSSWRRWSGSVPPRWWRTTRRVPSPAPNRSASARGCRSGPSTYEVSASRTGRTCGWLR